MPLLNLHDFLILHGLNRSVILFTEFFIFGNIVLLLLKLLDPLILLLLAQIGRHELFIEVFLELVNFHGNLVLSHPIPILVDLGLVAPIFEHLD